MHRKPIVPILRRCHPLARGLIGGWFFDRQGDTVYDVVGSNHGLVTNFDGLGCIDAKFGKGLDLFRTSTTDGGWVTFGLTPTLTRDFAVAGWLRLPSSGPGGGGDSDDSAFASRWGANKGWMLYFANSGVVRLYTDAISILTAQNVRSHDDRWHHWSGTKRGTVGEIYLDGQLVASGTLLESIQDPGSTYPFLIGDYGTSGGVNDQGMDGTWDHVLLYDRGLTSEEVRWLYSQPFAMFWQWPKAYFQPFVDDGIEDDLALIYGRSPIYGDGSIYGGTLQLEAEVPRIVLPTRRALTLVWYDYTGQRIGWISSNQGEPSTLQADFELTPAGPGKAEIRLAETPGFAIQHGTRLEIYLWNDPSPYWAGTIVETPEPGDGELVRLYRGVGYERYLDRIFVEQETYEKTGIGEIAATLVQKYLDPETPVTYSANTTKTVGAAYKATKLDFRNISIRKALDQLAGLAGGFEFGVSADTIFFFRPETTTIQAGAHFWVGKNIEGFSVYSDSSKLANRIWVKSGRVQGDTKTNWLPLPVEDKASQAAYGLAVAAVTAPSVFHDADSYRLGGVELNKRKSPVQIGRIRGVVFEGKRIEAKGKARVTGRGGTAYELPIRKVKYRIKGPDITVNLDLGEVEPDMAWWVSDLYARREQLELLQQQSQTQFTLS